MIRVLALKADGTMSYCTCSPEQRGRGRCDHVEHQREGESENDFINRVSETEELSSYHMDEDEKENLMHIKGRKDLDDEECEGGYIELNTPVWSPSNISEFSEMSGINSSLINNVISGKIYVNKETLRLKKFKNVADEKKNDPEFDQKYYTGVEALNDLAESEGYEATKSVYVLPYYMRQNTGDIKNPINVLYNSLIVSDNSVKNAMEKGKDFDANKVQECYERLLDNKHVENHGFKPLTSHGGFAVDSLSDLVNGKSGIMRGYITGFSIPYSGRAVISPNIKMEYGEVGIPSKMAANILSPTIKTTLKEWGYSDEKADAFLDRLSEGKATQDDVIKLDKIMLEKDCKVLINRQPSLHMGSMVCCKARATEIVESGKNFRASEVKYVSEDNRDTIQLNPMLAKGFNADHDGDTMAVYALNNREIADTAWDEMSPFSQFISHNPKNLNESMTVPTKDALFGLMSILGNGD